MTSVPSAGAVREAGADVTLSPAKRALLARLRHRSVPQPDGPAVLRPGAGRPGLVLVHPVGGAVLCYAALVSALGGDEPVWGFAADRPADDLPDAGRLAGLAERYLATLDLAERRWVFAGWSFGGVVAYEMARRAGGTAVLLDTAYPGSDPPEDEAAIRRFFLHDLCRTAGLPPPEPAAGAGGTEPGVADLAARAGLTADLTAAEIEARYRVCRSNALALAAHRPGRYEGPVWYVRAGRSPDHGPAWRQVAPDLRTRSVPGEDHYTLLGAGPVGAVAAVVREALRRADRGE
ncbi:hypothetical protein F8279_21420 [Micromonospora sp. AMSO1212t]|uniref:thioesterase domain-containing protein n=1 Tax=Micromonospora sp. AMSO1212t TaxID=2650565 RepID=UPI00124B181F|nr:thioesterase domain-containing protein [Micromonospora sp. AMSO1212t]KAB1904384.1 hypothetical protein F8279_21420 [Micromonospora sp. AMSO1212t]